MAKRINLTQEPSVRARIGATQIAKRLESHVNGVIELSPTQVAAAKILLAKTIPDLSSVELKGDPDKPLNIGLAPQYKEIIERFLQQGKPK